MRTDEEIIERIKLLKPRDSLGFKTCDLIVRLPSDKVTQFLPPDFDLTDYKPEPRDRESLLRQMLDYMPFAWEKANNCRGISASRTMSHYTSWIWLMGDDLGDLMNCEYYGKDNLVKICEHYGWDAKQWDDDIRINKPLLNEIWP